jgi:phospholipid/cholesterol/gamma-HCH transport system ATP-binding protein
MGGSGCGKSTLLKSLIGLLEPKEGAVFYGEDSLYGLPLAQRENRLRQVGVLYQGGALWSDRTVAENVAFPLEEFTDLSPRAIAELVRYKLALVGLEGAENRSPDALSGGYAQTRLAGSGDGARPRVLFLDEPSAGLDRLMRGAWMSSFCSLTRGWGRPLWWSTTTSKASTISQTMPFFWKNGTSGPGNGRGACPR